MDIKKTTDCQCAQVVPSRNHAKGQPALKFSRFGVRARKMTILMLLLTLLINGIPFGAMAEVYTPGQIDQIALLIQAKESGRLKPSNFEENVSRLIQNSPDDLELTTKLLQHNLFQAANMSPKDCAKGIADILAVAKKVRATSTKHQQAANKAQEVATAQAAVISAQQAVKIAADASKAAHDAAAASPNDAAKAADASAKDQEVAKAQQKQTDAEAKVPKLDSPVPPTNSMWTVSIWTGAKLENPYSITNGMLKPNNSKTAAFIDLELTHRYVLSGNTSGEDNEYFWGKPRRYGDGKWDWFIPGQVFPDLNFRMGYVFNNSSTTPTNLTVSTIAGGSDLYSDNSIGVPFWRWSQPDLNQQATIELGGGFTTDKEFLAIHPNYFVGLGYQFHNKDWLWQTRFGLGAADVPRITSGSTVATDSRGLPQFDFKATPTWGTTITYSLNPTVKLQLGANAFFEKQATWNLSAGVSIDPAAAFKGFTGGSK